MVAPTQRPTLTPAESAAIDEFVAAVRSLLGEELREVRLFGSRARGEGTAESDIDLAVIVTSAGRARRREVYDLAFDLGLRHRVQLAPAAITETQLADLRARERRFALDLDREGTRL